MLTLDGQLIGFQNCTLNLFVTLGLLMKSNYHAAGGGPKGASPPEGFASPAPLPVADYGVADFLPGEHGEFPLAPGQKKKVMPKCCTRIPACST